MLPEEVTLNYGDSAGKVHFRRWLATNLHLLDHEMLIYRHAGLAMRLTDVAGTVAKLHSDTVR